jgi:hypothetical protein
MKIMKIPSTKNQIPNKGSVCVVTESPVLAKRLDTIVIKGFGH